MLRPATLHDLETVSGWVKTAAECALWAGWRVRFPIELASLAAAIDFTHHGGLVLVDGRDAAAFGQIVPKSARRAHLARLIVEPSRRGQGIGTRLVTELLERARHQGHATASLNVDPTNDAAIALYTKMQFSDSERPFDEPDPHGSRYMQRKL